MKQNHPWLKHPLWESETGGAIDAFELKDWFYALPATQQKRIQQAFSEPERFSEGYYGEGGRNAGPSRFLIGLFNTLWAKMNDQSTAECVLEEAIAQAIKHDAPEHLYVAYVAAVEMHWRKGYTSAKDIREKGLFNRDLQRVQDYALAVAEMLVDGAIRPGFTMCAPLDRLFLIHKLTGRQQEGLAVIADLERAGWGQLHEVLSYKVELSKPPKEQKPPSGRCAHKSSKGEPE